MTNLEDELKADSRRESRPETFQPDEEELILSVANLEQNFGKVRSYEAESPRYGRR